jgi:hypothetical protein
MDTELEIVSLPPTDSTTLKDWGRGVKPGSLIQYFDPHGVHSVFGADQASHSWIKTSHYQLVTGI